MHYDSSTWHIYIWCFMQLSFRSDRIKELQAKSTLGLYFIFTCVATFTGALYLFMWIELPFSIVSSKPEWFSSHWTLYSVSLWFSYCLDKDFLKHLEPINMLKGSVYVCVLGYTINPQPSSWKPFINLHFRLLYRASHLASSESLGPSQFSKCT